MVFSSPVFLFAYLPLTLAIYYLVPRRWRNLALFLLSLVFYGWDKPVYIPVMLFSVTVSYLCGFPIGKYRDSDRHRARVWLTVSLVLNLAVLVFFKYTNFIIENLRLIPPLAGVLHPLEWLDLPVGISFYTFQIMSYSIDLYRGENQTQRSYIAFGTYVALFPQLIADPLCATAMWTGSSCPARTRWTDSRRASGGLRSASGRRFCWGMRWRRCTPTCPRRRTLNLRCCPAG